MILHYCDGCGEEVTNENGVINMKELTVEDDEGLKVSIAIEVNTMRNGNPIEHSAVCALCISRRFAQWADSLSDAPVAQRTEHPMAE